MIVFAIALGLVLAYLLFMRPVLRAVPAFRQFFEESDGFWPRTWALCGRSTTVLWSYLLALAGTAAQWIEPLADALNSTDTKTEIAAALQSSPRMLGYLLIGISLITFAARLRSIGRER